MTEAELFTLQLSGLTKTLEDVPLDRAVAILRACDEELLHFYYVVSRAGAACQPSAVASASWR
jgi:hypothetical protein